MGVTNDYERDFNDTSFLKRPGRIDLVVFQNTADAGDGKPGMQRCFRNYLHEGGMENDLDLVGHGIKGTSVLINNAELQQLSNINAVTITNDQWGYVGNMNQELTTTSIVNFGGMNLTGAGGISLGTNSIAGIGYTIEQLELAQLGNIASATISGTQWGYLGASDNQGFGTGDTPSFTGLTLTGNLALVANSITGTTVNINNAELQQLSNIGGAVINGTKWGYVASMQDIATTATPSFAGATLTGNVAMGSNKITGLAAATVDTDAPQRSEHCSGDATSTIQWSNDPMRSTDSTPYVKLKEITCHTSLKNFNVNWEMRTTSIGQVVWARVYINGSAVGVEKSVAVDTFAVQSDEITFNVYPGDLIQIYGKGPGTGDCEVKNMDINFDLFESNASY